MHLILSSCDFSNAASRRIILENLPKPIEQCRVLFIPNEKATSEKIRSGKYHKWMEDRGFSRENISVFDPAVADKFSGLDLDVIYVSGGNTFQILQKLRTCGFDREITRYVKSGVTYIGGSAGAHLVTRNLAHVALYDPVPTGMADFSALGLFDGILVCHYASERRAQYDALRAEGKYKVYILSDEDSIVINE